MDWIRWFADLDRSDVALAGGKGANLGEMARANLPVPPGFVLLTPAYRAFVEGAGLQAEIERIATAVRPEDAASVQEASAAIRALFERHPVPDATAPAVLEAYGQLGRGRVAVRSSATAEDLPGASFAGQQETYLNVEGEEALLEAVRRCWSSLWTARALAYRARQSIAPGEVALAVVVQRQVEAEVAGVLFTANPVNGRRDQMVIDGAWGLGEAVVSGQVTPDHWVADAATGAVLEEQIAAKAVMTARRDGQTVTVRVPEAMRSRPVLDAGQVAELVAMGRRVADHFGAPQDIEWVWAEGRFYLVQSRPITSLFPLPEPLPGPREPGERVYVCLNVLQGLVEPFTPMGLSFFGALGRGPAALMGHRLEPGMAPPALKGAAGRLYLDVTNPLRHRRLRPLILRLPGIMDRPTALTLQALAERPELQVDPHLPLPVRPSLRVFFRAARSGLLAWMAPDAARRRGARRAWAFYRSLEAEAERLEGIDARVRFVQERAAAMFYRLFPDLFPVVGVGMACRWIAEGKLARWLGDASPLQPILRSLPHNPTTEMDLALWRLSRQLKAEGAEVSAEHPGVRAFLAEYGHRAVREIDVGMPRWSEDPAHVLNVLRTYLSHGEEADAEAHFRRGAVEAERAESALVERVRREKGAARARLLRFLLIRLRALAGFREFPKFLFVKCIALFRRVLWQVGEELVAAGRLERAEQVFYVRMDDVLDPGTDLQALAAGGEASYRQELGRRAVPRVITSTGEALYAPPAAAAAGGLAGTAASPGVYEGRVRVIHDPRGAKLEPGEVLVAPGTDPAWTPLFLSAGALVMEIGGVMSHGSVVAREYGIPAVVGVHGATQRLRTGQRVRVDGEAGVVIPLDDA